MMSWHAVSMSTGAGAGLPVAGAGASVAVRDTGETGLPTAPRRGRISAVTITQSGWFGLLHDGPPRTPEIEGKTRQRNARSARLPGESAQSSSTHYKVTVRCPDHQSLRVVPCVRHAPGLAGRPAELDKSVFKAACLARVEGS